MTSIEEKELLCTDQNINRSKKFMVTKKIANYEKAYLYIDEINKLWCLPKISFWTSKFKKEKTLFYSYSDIVSFELQADGKVITSSTSGGLGSAVVGGILFGGVGAIVGSNTGKKRTNSTIYNTYTINITLNSMQNPNITFDVPTQKIANEIISALQLMYNSQIKDAETNTKKIDIDNNSVADEIKKFKELLDMGAITETEFDIKKKQLLGINSNDTKSESISNDEIKQFKIKCKVCGKEINYNENETCSECDKIIKEKLQIKKEAVSVKNTSTKILVNNEEKNEKAELDNFKNTKNDEPIEEVDNKDNITNTKNASVFKKIINGLRHFLAILCLLIFLDDIKHIGYLLLAISISPYLYTFIKKINPQITNKVLKRIAIFLPIIVLLIVSIFIEPNYFKKAKIELTVGESYSIEFNKIPENYQLICTNTEIISIENNILHANNVGKTTVQLQIENKIVDTLYVTIKNIQAPEISENKNNQAEDNAKSKNEIITDATNVIYLSYGKEAESEYCEKFILDGEEFLEYKIPSGIYKLEVISSNEIFADDIWVEYDKIIKNSSGYDEQEPAFYIDINNNRAKITDYTDYYKTNDISKVTVNTYSLNDINIEITDDVHIHLVDGTNIKLTKIN